MIKINGIHKCSYCGENINWEYTTSERMSETNFFTVIDIEENRKLKTYANKVVGDEVSLYCPHCDCLNSFHYSSEE